MPVQLSSASAAMHGALVPIAYQTSDGSVGSITFNNIPQTYQDLMLVAYTRDSRTGVSLNEIGYNLNNAGSVTQSNT
jgi:hypothetical protein